MSIVFVSFGTAKLVLSHRDFEVIAQKIYKRKVVLIFSSSPVSAYGEGKNIL